MRNRNLTLRSAGYSLSAPFCLLLARAARSFNPRRCKS